MARQWWTDVFSSPMRNEFIDADIHALLRLVILVDSFWKTSDLKVAQEIRLMEREFGLTPLSRRRLEWSIVQAEQSKDNYQRRRVNEAQTIDYDPRSILDEE